jgi:hypothetical protein
MAERRQHLVASRTASKVTRRGVIAAGTTGVAGCLNEQGSEGTTSDGTASPRRAGTPAQRSAPDGTGTEVLIDSYDGDDLGEMWNNALDDVGRDGTQLRLSPGEYTLSTTVDYTGGGGKSGRHVVNLHACSITVEGEDGIGIDATGSGRVHTMINGGQFVGSESAIPRTAVLLARPSDGGSAAFWKFDGTEWTGHWADAGIVGISAEAALFYGCRFENANDTGYTLAWTRGNTLDFTSQNGSIADGDNPTSTNRFYGCGFVSKTTPGDGLMFLDGVARMSFFGGFMRTNSKTDENYIESPMIYDTEGMLFKSVQAEFGHSFIHLENNSGSPSRWFNIEISGGGLGGVRGDFVVNDGENKAILNSCDLFSVRHYGTGGGGIDVEEVVYSTINMFEMGEVRVSDSLGKNILQYGTVDDIAGDFEDEGNNVAIDPTTGTIVANQVVSSGDG